MVEVMEKVNIIGKVEIMKETFMKVIMLMA